MDETLWGKGQKTIPKLAFLSNSSFKYWRLEVVNCNMQEENCICFLTCLEMFYFKALQTKKNKACLRKLNIPLVFLYPVVNILSFYYCSKILRDISQNPWGWKGPPEMVQSSFPWLKGSTRARHPGLCPVGFCVCTRIKDLTASLVVCSSIFNLPSQWNDFLHFSGISVFQFVPMAFCHFTG